MDKSSWTDGPWTSEPDRVEWRTNGLPCLIVRADTTGALCGYVAVPKGHPFHGVGYDDVPDVSVHGGLTYSDACGGHVCHVPQPGEPDDVWWLGFDCAHSGDMSPAYDYHGIYRDVAYVRAEVDSLAAQCAAHAIAAT